MSAITGMLSNENSLTSASSIGAFVRKAIWALPLWAAMLFLGTLTHQPDPQTDFASFAAYVTTKQFLLSHLINSIGGAAIGSIGVIAVLLYLQGTRAAGKALAGAVASVAGNTLTSSVFGAAAFAQTAAGHAYLAGQENALEFYNLVYSAPLFVTALVGLLFFMGGGAWTGAAINASGLFPRWIGWVYALTVLGFVLSNFIVPVGQSLMSALLFVSTLMLAWRVSRA